MNRKTCYSFGTIYLSLVVIDFLIIMVNAQQYTNFTIIIFTYFLFFLSIRYIFLLEIKRAVAIGLFSCAVSLIADYFISGWMVFHSTIIVILLIILNVFILFLNLRTVPKEEATVKKKIIEFGGKIPRLKVKDISEKSNVDTSTVFKTLKKMINNQEIYADYFESTKTIAFNQIANVENLDSLMKLYEDWEQQQLKKV
jgi:hypothetical protein